jgi:hypothetical protein
MNFLKKYARTTPYGQFERTHNSSAQYLPETQRPPMPGVPPPGQRTLNAIGKGGQRPPVPELAVNSPNVFLRPQPPTLLTSEYLKRR